MTQKKCYVCPSENHVDDHHYDCKYGEISPETVPLCRRCHQTYHIWGLGAFSPDTTEKALEVENKRREILRSLPPDHPEYRRAQFLGILSPMRMEDIKRSDYWYKKHGIKPDRPSITKGTLTPAFQFHLPRGEPLCGWDWVHEHLYDLLDWVPRIEITGPRFEFAMDIDNAAKLKETVKVLRGIKRNGLR